MRVLNKVPTIVSAGATLLCFLSLRVLAQAPPNAGEVLQQTQTAPALKERTIDTPNGVRVQVPQSPAMSQRDSSVTVEVKGYRISGNTAFAQNALVRLVESRTGKLTLADLTAAAQEISR